MNVAVTSYDMTVVVMSHVSEMVPPGGGGTGAVDTSVTVTIPLAPCANSRITSVLPITIGWPGLIVVL